MLLLRILPDLLLFATSAAGIRAAILWWRASNIQLETSHGEQSGSHHLQQDTWIGALLTAYSKSSELNSKAAWWSAWAALLGGLAAIMSILPY